MLRTHLATCMDLSAYNYGVCTYFLDTYPSMYFSPSPRTGLTMGIRRRMGIHVLPKR